MSYANVRYWALRTRIGLTNGQKEEWSIMRNNTGTGIRVEGGQRLALRVARALNAEHAAGPRRAPRRPSLASGQLSVARRVLVADLRRCLALA